ncbi:MAG: alpha/beta hydrolase [Firmicutes bacterium]|nr:alpha/beta hydrolase [Bacillota bacterium]
MNCFTVESGPYTAQVIAPKDAAKLPLLYLHDACPQPERVRSLLTSRLTLVSVSGLDWYRDMTPWPADRVFADGADYGGGAAAYLRRLTEDIVPKVEAGLGFTPVKRGLAGYSLAGLFSLWAFYRTDSFDLCGSMSGSLWFDGFQRFMEQEPLVRLPERLYLSLGVKEKDCRSPQVGRVQEITEKTSRRFRELGAEVCWQLQPGGHTSQVDKRIAEGLSWLAAT